MEERPYRRLSDCEYNVVINGDKLDADILCEGNLMINCIFKGKINSSGVVFISRKSDVQADIECSSMIIEGKVEGRVFVTDRIEVRRASILSGIIFEFRLLRKNRRPATCASRPWQLSYRYEDLHICCRGTVYEIASFPSSLL